MTDKDQAEKRAYARGYAAGRVYRAKATTEDARYRRREAFWQRAFLAVLPFSMGTHGWKRGDAEIVSIDDRVRLAAEIAESATKRAYA